MTNNILSSFHVIPNYSYYNHGYITLPKYTYDEYINFFKLNKKPLTKDIFFKIKNTLYPATVRIARINNKGQIKTRSDRIYPERDVVQFVYRNPETFKALRKLNIYSYASTIDKSKPKLKELVEFIHDKDNIFKVKPISKQETDFDEMFHFLEDKNLFSYWKDHKENKKRKDKLILSHSNGWISKKNLPKYSSRSNVIYVLNNSTENQIYIGKANIFGNRVTEKSTRTALNDFDRFMFIELNPDFAFILTELENYSIHFIANIFKNIIGIKGLNLDSMTLVNKQVKKTK